MQKPRRYERIFLVADVTVRPNDKQPRRFPAEMFNVSRIGAGVFSKRHFSRGEIVGVEVNLSAKGAGRRTFLLYGTVRHVDVGSEGNVLGIEFVVGDDAGDYCAFEQYMDEHVSQAPRVRSPGFTLIEMCIAMTVICLLATMSIPLYTRAVEYSRVDVASAKLRTVWSAQRVYWLEHRTFATGLAAMQAMDLLDASLVNSQTSSDAVYVYQVLHADGDTFRASARRNGSASWTGQLEIDESGNLTGAISGPGSQTIVPTP